MDSYRGPRFIWDDYKAYVNERKHGGITFEEAATVFDDPQAVIEPDLDRHSRSEERDLYIGYSSRGRILTVVHTYRGDQIRIISARQPTQKERRHYEEGRSHGSHRAARPPPY